MRQHRIDCFDGIDGRKLMDIYRESNTGNIDYFYPEMTDRALALQRVEQRFLDFIRTSFFNKEGNEYRILEKDHIWVSALRLYRIGDDSYYIEALETHPEFRRRGYAACLLNSVIGELKRNGPFTLYDCVGKRNEPSINAHKKCGFQIAPGAAFDYLRNVTEEDCCGMRYIFEIHGNDKNDEAAGGYIKGAI